MRKFSAAFLIVLSLLSTSVAHASTASIKQEIVRNYYHYRVLLESANSEDLIAMQTDDYLSVGRNGEVLNREQSDFLTRIFADSVRKVNGVNVRINRMTVERNRVVCLVTEYYDVYMIDPTNPGGGLHRYVTNVLARHIWVPTDDGYKLQRAEWVRGHGTLDGTRL